MDRLFGTDGIRGTPGAYPLTDGMLFKLGKAAANLLFRQKKITDNRLKIIVGKDTRLSCERIEVILTSGVSSRGVDVVLAGVIPTPGLAFLTRKFKADIGVMISASHNKAEDNGIKFFSNSGYKLTQNQEEEMEGLVFSDFIDLEELSLYSPGSVYQLEDGHRAYINFLKSKAADLSSLNGLKIVIDCAYGALCGIAPAVFKELGAQISSINDRPDGANINLNCGALHPENMAKLVTKHKAALGFSFDGDGDRVILSDEKGNLLDGDYIMAIIALHLMKKNRLPKNTLVATAISNYGLQEAIENAGGRLIRTNVGDKYVTEALLKDKLLFGGEQSGHIIFLNHSTTADALVTCLEILKIMKETGKKLSELALCMQKFPQVLVNVRVREKRPFEEIAQVSEAISRCKSKLEGNGRLLVRYSGTEPVARIMVEGRNKDLIEEIANSLATQIKREIGLEDETC